jgi:hypothetical protein
MASAEVVRNTFQSTEGQLVGARSISPLVETKMGPKRGSNEKKDAKGKGKADSTRLRGNNKGTSASTRQRASKSQGLPAPCIMDDGKGKGKAFIENSADVSFALLEGIESSSRAVDVLDDTKGGDLRDSDGIVRRKVGEIERLEDENAERNTHHQKQATEWTHKNRSQASATSSAMGK